MIPKIIHFCWFGGGKKSEVIESCMQSWCKFLPDYEIREWNENNFPLLQSNAYVREAYEAKKWAFVADVCRLYALSQEGGIYLDTDVEVRKSFDEFLKLDFFIGSEKNGTFHGIGTGVIGAAKNNKIINDMLALYNDLHFVKADGSYDLLQNTKRLIPVLLARGAADFYAEEQAIELSKKAKIYPINYFCVDTPKSYAVHHFEASWVEDYKLRNAWHLPLGNTYRLSLYRYKKMKKNAVFTYPPSLSAKIFELNYSKKWKLLLEVEKANYYRRSEAVKLDWKIEKYHHKYADNDREFYLKTSCYALKSALKSFKLVDNFGVDDQILHINIKLGGGLGDMIISLNYLQQLFAKFSTQLDVSIIVSKIFKQQIRRLLQGHSFVNKVLSVQEKFPKCDVSVSLVRVPVLEFADLHKVNVLAPNLREWLEKINNFAAICPEMLNAGTVSDNLLERYSILQKRNRLSQADIGNFVKPTTQFKISLPQNKAEILQKFKLNKNFITVQRGVGKADRLNHNSTRCWAVENYNQLLKLLKKDYPNYQIVQIGDESCAEIENIDFNLCGQTSFEEMLVILDNAKVHIDGECGMVHLRHFLNAKPSVVLFGPTNENFYGYPENVNVTARPCGAVCDWLHLKWHDFCLFSGAEPLCQQALTPQNVYTQMKGIL